MTRYLNLQDIIAQVEKSLEDENYIAALTLALTIPDKCGKAEYPNAGVGRRYIDWYDVWCNSSDPEASADSPPDANGKIIYKLRCALLHDNSTELQYTDQENDIKIDDFELEMTDDNKWCFSVFASSITNGEVKQLRIRIIDLCKWICYGAGTYYKKNKEKVDQSNSIKVVDYRHRFKK